jgi:hypothetical protein
MKVIYMEQTLTFMVNSKKTKEAFDFATKIVSTGEMKQTKDGLKYVVLETK